MNDDKLVKLSEKAIEETFKLFNDMLSILFRPGGVEIGYLIRDKVQYWRLKSAVNTWEKTKKLFEKKGIKIENLSPVAPKILIPLLEHCSLEDDEYMQDKWAALLANAADPETAKDVKPAYVEILKQITPIEAKLLDYMFYFITECLHRYTINGLTKFDLSATFSPYYLPHKKYFEENSINITKDGFAIIVDNLIRLGLCIPREEKEEIKIRENDIYPPNRYKIYRNDRSHICLTSLGFNFVKACRFG